MKYRYIVSLPLILLFVCGLLQPAIAADTSITLAWTPIDAKDHPYFEGYKVYRKKVGGTGWKKLGEVDTTTITYTDTVRYGNKYYFYVTAFDVIGLYEAESDPSNMVSWPIQVLALKEVDVPVDVVHSGSTYTIDWYADPKAETFKLSYSTNNGVTWVPIVGSITGNSYPWTVTPPGATRKNVSSR